MRSKPPWILLLKSLVKDPNAAYPLTRALIRKHLGTQKDYMLGTGRAVKPPMQVSLRITHSCNHRCAVCGQYGKKGYLKNKSAIDVHKTLPVERYKELVDELSFYKPIYYVTGGEPFLYPGFMELMNYIKKKGSILSVVTNGVLLEKNAQEIVAHKWDNLLISFDGPRDIHDACRNLPGAYDTSVKGILKVNEVKKRLDSITPFVMTSTTLSETNAPYLEDTLGIGGMLNPYLMVIYLSWFTSDTISEEQRKVLKQVGVEAFTCNSYSRTFTKEQAMQFQDAITRIKSKKWPFPYIIIPDINTKDIARYYLEPKQMFGYSKCVAPFFMVDIMPNGDVTTCRDFIDVKVGSIVGKPLLEVWNCKKFMEFRKLLIGNKGMLPQCSRCCGLMGF